MNADAGLRSGAPTGAGPFRTRLLGPDDAEAWRALRLDALQRHPGAFASSADEEVDRAPDTVARRLESTDQQATLGVFDASQLVGSVSLQRESLRKVEHKVVLWGMVVAWEVRGRGAGRQLLQAALAHVRGWANARWVTLGVNADNAPARALYASVGFHVYGHETESLCVDGVFHDELLMRCRL